VGYTILEHTADLGIEATGATREEALEWAAFGLMQVITGKPQPHPATRPERELNFFVEAPDLPALVVAFLSELLWYDASEDLLWLGGGITFGTSQDGILRLDVRGNACMLDRKRHGQGVEVKAVTYHGIRFEPHGKEWLLRAYLDI
jgi:SHS2 domain-containing protein